MADTPRILVTSKSDLSDIIQDQERLKRETRELADALGVEEKQLRQVERELNKQARANNRARRAMERTRKEGIQANTRALEKSRVAAGTWAGQWVNDIGDVVEAGMALGPMGVAGAAGLALVVGELAILGGSVYAMFELAFGAEAALKKLDQLPDAIRPVVHMTAEEEEATRRLTGEWESLGVELSAVAAEIGSVVAPTVEVLLVNTREGIQLFREWWPEIRAFSDAFVEAHATLLSFNDTNRQIIDNGREYFAQQRDLSAQSARRTQVEVALAEAMERVSEAQAKAVGTPLDIDALQDDEFGGVEANLDRELSAFLRNQDAKTRAAQQARARRAREEEAERRRKQREEEAEERRRKREAEQKAREEARAAEAAIREATRAREEAFREEQAAAQAAAEAEMQRIQMHQNAAVAATSAISDVAGALSQNAGVVVAAKTAEALAYQSVAMARALAEGGLIAGVPAALGFAGIIAGAIAEAKAAPRHMGGSMAPDEGVFRVRDGEAYQAVPETDPSQTRQSSAPTTVVVQLDDKTYRAQEQRRGRTDALWSDRRRYATSSS